jgi:lipopolysaccharide cholinephosphotransferase
MYSPNINYHKLSEIEVKAELLELLKRFDQFCTSNNLKYFLGGGTLLGAVRHKGFIPWDDDIDLMMPRNDYEKMVQIARDQFKGDDTFLITDYRSDPSHIHLFAKIYNKKFTSVDINYKRFIPSVAGLESGLYIDIFPIDGIPEKESSRVIFFSKIKMFKYLIILSVQRFDIIPKGKSIFSRYFKYALTLLFGPICRVFGHNFFLMRFDNFIRRYEYDNSTYVAACTGLYGLREVEKKEVFADSVNLDFEGYFFKAPIGYKQYLAHHYGESFMQLPKVTSRINHFNGEVYSAEAPEVIVHDKNKSDRNNIS